MLKDLFEKGKCALGFHGGDWRYVQDQHCQQERVCPRCKNKSLQLVHTWQAWQYGTAQSCEMTRHCSRCQELENKTEHVWASPIYDSEGACTQVRPCSRCNDKVADRTIHVWNDWSYQTPGQCSQRSACSRCGEAGKDTRIVHEWDGWQDSQFYGAPVRVCRRCGDLVFNLGNGGSDANRVSLQMVDRAVQDVVTSKDAGVVRERMSRHSAVLLSPVASKYFTFAVDQLAPDPNAKDMYRNLAALVDRCRAEGMDNVFSPPVSATPTPPAPSPAAATSHTEAAQTGPPQTQPAQTGPAGSVSFDTRFIGHWRHTEILGGSYPIDTHCVLDPQGRFQWFSKSSRGTQGPEQGGWTSSGQTLLLSFDSGAKRTFECVVQAATILCPQEQRYRLWQRVG
jgi:hypothetical protein